MGISLRRVGGLVLLAMALGVFGGARAWGAAEVGEPAPDFKLPSTGGVDIGLRDFRGKKWVFLEFYGGDFHPT
jgi:hypothetical protein